MLASLHTGSAGSLLRSSISSIEEIVQRLEFAATAGGDNPALCCRLHGLDCLCLDLKAAAAGDGVTGAEVFLMVAQARDALTTAVEAHDEGDLDQWRSCRTDVLETLANLRQLVEPQLEAELVVRAATPATPAVPQAPAKTMPAAQADVDPGRKGEKAEKGPATPRGRPPKAAGATRETEAAWWRDRAHLEPAIADQSEDDRLDQLFDRMMEEEFEVRLVELGAEDLPKWWPDGPNGRPVQAVRFRDRWKTTSSNTWAKYVQRSDNDENRGREVVPRYHQGNVEPQSSNTTPKPAKTTAAQAAARAFEDAAEIAADLLITPGSGRGKLLDDLRGKLSRIGIVGRDADDLLDLDPAAMVAEFEKRRLAVERVQAGTKTRR